MSTIQRFFDIVNWMLKMGVGGCDPLTPPHTKFQSSLISEKGFLGIFRSENNEGVFLLLSLLKPNKDFPALFPNKDFVLLLLLLV